MHRRQLLKVLGLSLSAGPLARPPAAQDDEGPEPWRFDLDGRSRWSLRDGRRTVIDGAEIRVDLAGGASAALDELEGVRRLRSGGRRGSIWSVVGRFEGLEVTAQLTDGLEPRITVRVRGLDEARAVEAIHFTGGVSTGQATAWVNGIQSWSPCGVVPLGAAAVTSHWQVALLGRGGMGLLFGEDDGGAGELRLRGRRLDAASVFGGRLVSAAHSPAIATLTVLPSDDPLGALANACAARAGIPQGSLPAGWRSWHAFPGGVTEQAMLAAVEFARTRLDPRVFRVIQLDEGYQRAAGDWDANARFPLGHCGLTERIRSAGFEPALWMAPFAVTDSSGIPAEHPEWLVTGPDARPLVLDHRPSWGGAVHALDASQRDVQDWLRGQARRACDDWGYARLVLDHLYLGSAGGRRIGGASAEEALRAGLRALREGARRVPVVAGAAPLQAALGRVEGLSAGDHVRHNWDGVKLAAGGLLQRLHLSGRAWVSDPDALVVGGALSLDEARAWASVVALTGSVTMSSDVLDTLDFARLDVIQRAMPVLSLQARVLDLRPPVRAGADLPSWIVARVADDWWTLAAINWSDAAQRMSINLDVQGVRGPFAAYDVWSGERVADVRGPLSLQVPAHACRVLGLRRPRTHPFVLGSTRHMVQGVVDVAQEEWHAAERRLSGKAQMLDGRPYALTIATPRGFRAQSCTGGSQCAVTTMPTALRLDFAAAREDIDWEVQF